MKSVLALLVAVLMPLNASPADQIPLEIKLVDDRLSIHAESVPLGLLLALLDRTAGTTSRVPPELANRNVSVQFKGLHLDQAVKKLFEGLPLDYIVLKGTQIIVTAVSKSITGPAQSAPPLRSSNPQSFVNPNRLPAPPRAQNPFQAQGNPNPAVGANRNQGQTSTQPAIIQTPFGPMVNPRANQSQQQQPGMPMAVPGQTGFPFGTSRASPTGPTSPGGMMSPSDSMMLQKGPLGVMPGTPAAQPNSPTNVFGNTSPMILELNKNTPNSPKPKP